MAPVHRHGEEKAPAQRPDEENGQHKPADNQATGMTAVAEAIKALAAGKQKILILTHHNADIDAVATTLALHVGLKQLGIETDYGVAESIAKPTHRLAAGFSFIMDPDCSAYDVVILAETSVPEQLASVKNLRADIVVDHHPPGKLVERAKAVVTKEQVIDALRTVQDPELHIDIVTLELLRGVEVRGSEVTVKMTFTTPFCPYGPALAEEAQQAVLKIKGVTKADVDIDLDPPWQPSDDVKAALGMPV